MGSVVVIIHSFFSICLLFDIFSAAYATGTFFKATTTITLHINSTCFLLYLSDYMDLNTVLQNGSNDPLALFRISPLLQWAFSALSAASIQLVLKTETLMHGPSRKDSVLVSSVCARSLVAIGLKPRHQGLQTQR